MSLDLYPHYMTANKAGIFQCHPVQRAWNLTVPGTCLNLRAVFIGNAVPNIVTDAIILCMPLYHVWKLHVRAAQKVALTGIFLLGAFVIVASIYRFTTVLKLNPFNLSCMTMHTAIGLR